jgi:2-dehydropantoate 2-reductase
MLAKAGAPVILIGRPTHVDAINRNGLLLESIHFQDRISVPATTDISAASDAEIILLSVKTLDTERAAEYLSPLISNHSVLISLQNGVDNGERIRAALPTVALLLSVVYVAVEMPEPGHVRHSARGDLVIGHFRGGLNPHGCAERLEEVAPTFERASIPCRISRNIQADLWVKLTMNCAYNAISALGRSRYGRMVENGLIRGIITKATEECLAVARCAGVIMPGDQEVIEQALVLGQVMSQAQSSTAQDIHRGRPTEIDSLNGYISRRAAELSVPTPVNDTLYALVKLLETTTTR